MIGFHFASFLSLVVFATTEAATAPHGCLEKHDSSCTSPLPEIDEDGFLDLNFGVAQFVGAEAQIMMKHLELMQAYLHDSKHQDDESCQLHDDLCAFWAVKGECNENPEYMAENCAPACFTCSTTTQCPSKENLPSDVWVPGSLDRMFQNLATHPFYQEQYNLQVLLRPGMASGEEEDAPWVVVLDDFLTPEETETLIKLGGEQGFERSGEVGVDVSDQRTSSNSWCLNDCYDDAVTTRVLERIENLTAIPDSHGEYLQMLKYEETQFYGRHHDYLEHHLVRASGVRILTVFLYLNDVEEGGGTRFSTLDVVSMYCYHSLLQQGLDF